MEQITLSYSQTEVESIGHHFSSLTSLVPLNPISSPKDYDRMVLVLNALIDAGAGDDSHPLAGLLDLVGRLVGDYEDVHHPLPDATPVDVLRFLMEQHGLHQKDLPEIGSQGVVSEILNGHRALNVNQIAKLSERFGVAPGAFIAVGSEASRV